jgi:mannose-6-phosphate isomerase
MKKKNIKNIFPKSKSMGRRNWGNEILLGFVKNKFSLKKLELKKGSKGGLQYHRKKEEFGYLIKGKLKINFSLDNRVLSSKIISSGQFFYFPPYFIHQEEALTNCEIIEASTPYYNDRVRVEKKFGINNIEGLKTSKVSEIKKFT